MKLIKSILALAAAVFIGTSAQAAETENITLMASETAPAITTTATALKWYVTKDDTATERLDIQVERLVDSTAKVTITADGTEAGDKVAVLGLYGDGVLVKTINVTITEKEDVRNVSKTLMIGETWTYTTVATGTQWSRTANSESYKGYTINQIEGYFTTTVTRNNDGTATVTVTGKAPNEGKNLMVDINHDGAVLQTLDVTVVESVQDVFILKGGVDNTHTGSYSSSREWTFNDGTEDEGNIVQMTMKNTQGTQDLAVQDFEHAAEFAEFGYTKRTSQRYGGFMAYLEAKNVGFQTIRVGRWYNKTDYSAPVPSYCYNVYVYEEKTTNITMKAGDTLPVVFESEAAGAWEVEGLAENDETVTLSAYAGWTAKSFETSITANKATEETKTFKVKNNFCIYTVNLTVEQGTEIKNISIAEGGTYTETIGGGGAASSDNQEVASIDLNGNELTITGVAVGVAVCTVTPGYQYNVTVYSTVTNDALVGLGKTANINCTSDFEGAWTAQLAEGAEEGVVQIGNEWGESSTEFTLQLKGLKIGNTTLLVKNAYAQYTINVEVSAEVKNVDLKMEKGRTVTTNLTWGTSGVWTAVPKVGGDVATVELASQDPDTSNVAEVKAVMAGNSLWTISNGTHVAYTMNIKVWESIGFDPVSLLLGETNTLNLTSAAQASWTAVSSDENVATVTGSGVISTEFAPEIVAVGEGEATITVQNDYVKYTINVTVQNCVAEVGGKKFESLAKAVDAAEANDTVTVLTDCAGDGIMIDKSITIDFGGFTYTVDASLVGSPNTKSQAFNLVKGNAITLKNGTITSTVARMLVQNYASLTLDNMILDGEHLAAKNGKGNDYVAYTLSNCAGDTVITGNSVIKARVLEGQVAFAFDTYYQAVQYEDATVTVNGATIDGDVELAGGSLTLTAGTLNGELVEGTNIEKGTVTKADGFEAAAPSGWEWDDGVLVKSKSTITIHIVQGEEITDVKDGDGELVDGELELPAETTEVTLTLEADGLNVPVYKVITNGVEGVKVTNVTTKVATYAIKDGDTLEFFAEEADETDPDVTDAQIKQAIIDTIDDGDPDTYEAAVTKVNAIVGAGSKQISARELAAWINSNGIMSSDFGSSDYVVASAKLGAKELIKIDDDEPNTTIEFVNGVSVTADGFVFDVSIVIDDSGNPLGLDEKMTNIVAACIQTTENLSTGFLGATVDPGRVEILDEMKVLIKPAAETKSAEFFKFVIPPDPTGTPE